MRCVHLSSDVITLTVTLLIWFGVFASGSMAYMLARPFEALRPFRAERSNRLLYYGLLFITSFAGLCLFIMAPLRLVCPL